MSIAVTDLGNASNTAGATLTKSITVPAGAAVIVGVNEFGTQTAGSLSDATNGAYTLVKTQSDATAPAQTTAFIFLNSASLSTITLTYTKGLSGSHCTLTAAYATGILGAGALDTAVTTGASSASANPPIINVTSGTPAQSGELFVAFTGGQNNGALPTYTQSTGWNAPPPFSILQSGATNADSWLAGGYIINTGAGTETFNPSITAGSGARIADTVIIALKAFPNKEWSDSHEHGTPRRRDIEVKGFVPVPTAVVTITPFRANQSDAGFGTRRFVDSPSTPLVRAAKLFVADRSQFVAPPVKKFVDSPGFIPRAPAIIIRPSQSDILYRAIRQVTDPGFIQTPKLFFKQPGSEDPALFRALQQHFEQVVTNFPEVTPVIFDVFVKKKSKRRDLIERELEEKARRRAALELAIYGPEVIYEPPQPIIEVPKGRPVDIGDLAQVIAQAQAAQHQALRLQMDHDEEAELEAILREIL